MSRSVETGRWIDENNLIHSLEPDTGRGYTTTGCGFIPYVGDGSVVCDVLPTCIVCLVKGTLFYARR